MTVPARGWRTITVDGRPLLWRYKKPYCGCIGCPQDLPHVAVVEASRRGSVYLFCIDSSIRSTTPSLIADAVRGAIARGWRPGEGAGMAHEQRSPTPSRAPTPAARAPGSRRRLGR